MMNPTSRVLWSDGLFLQATHFQQQERHFDHQLQERLRIVQPYFKGFQTLEICESSLNKGLLRVIHVSGILNNGALFNAPSGCALPRHLNLLPEHEGLNIYLVLAAPSANELSLNLEPDGNGQFISTTFDTRNIYEPDAPLEPIEVITENLRLVVSDTPPNGYAFLKVAKLIEVDSTGRAHLSKTYSPTFSNFQQATYLYGLLKDVYSLIEQKIESIRRSSIRSFQNTAQLTDFLLLQTCQRHQGVLCHYLEHQGHHPETVFKDLTRLLGDLSLFESQDKEMATVAYDHDDQFKTFSALTERIKSTLSVSTEQRAVAIDLEVKQYGLRLAKIEKALLTSSHRFVLCARADMPHQELSQRLIGTLKIGSAQQIHELVNLNLPGISIVHLMQAPRELPSYADFLYFELQIKGSAHWLQVEKAQHLAVHCSDQLPGLAMELWAVRQIVKDAA